MRSLVQPPPALHCKLCKGELLFKRIDPGRPPLEFDSETFACVKCGREHSYRLIHDRYAVYSRRN
jgi:hypothetical protein